jgi:DNA modification methylase
MTINSQDQTRFDMPDSASPQGSVECLGMKFESDDKRREFFLERLRDKLKDPEFREIEGFPFGSDEDILTLSDPPYYTACPNPFIAEFIKHHGKPYDPAKPYIREPFAADVSEGKNDPIYNAHAYHTKVPHKAIMRYILHYTDPGDLVFDGFCGTGMTGVAAQLCGDRATIESLGYRVDTYGVILQQQTDDSGSVVWNPFSQIGPRRAVLNDLSPAATFIAYNYNAPIELSKFETEVKRISREVEDEYGWMYETLHPDGETKGKINYTVWSDIFICPECSREIVFWESAVDSTTGSVKDAFTCPHCRKEDISKRDMQRATITQYDNALQRTIRTAKQVPVLINYTAFGKRFEKVPDANDLALLTKIERTRISSWFPVAELPDGSNTRQPKGSHGLTHVHHFFTRRNLIALTILWSKACHPLTKMVILDGFTVTTMMSRFRVPAWVDKSTGPMKGWTNGTLYVPSLQGEQNWMNVFLEKAEMVSKALKVSRPLSFPLLACGSLSAIDIASDSADYLFLDPPFGSNINYSEVNSLWEQWLKVWTNNTSEAIENTVQQKGLDEYRQLMSRCFREAYRVLKPGRWMTVEFSNTKASVWNSIQTALTEAGFIVANVSALDKQQGSFKAVTTPTAVKQDLIISAYKPNGGFEQRFLKEAETEEGVWDFVRTHLKYLPVIKRIAGTTQLNSVAERDPRILFDQMVAYFVRKGYPVPLNSSAFQEGLSQRLFYRDGMYFLPEQVLEYDKKRLVAGVTEQMSLFVSDEASAISWLRLLLARKPQTTQDIHPLFIKELGGWQKYEKPLELSELLEQNFLRYDGTELVPEQIHAYLSSNWSELRKKAKDDPALRAKAKHRWYVPDPNKAGDLEKLRERALLKEFWEYLPPGYKPTITDSPDGFIPGPETKNTLLPQGKRVKVLRTEAVRAGFKFSWQRRDYRTIIAVAQRIPENVLQEDPKLLMWYDQAVTRQGEK